MKQKEDNVKYNLISALSLITVLFVWYLMTDVFDVMNTNMLPSPVKIFKSLIRKFYDKNPDGSTLLVHLAASLQIALSGYSIGLVIGIPLGICMAWYDKFDNYARPLFDLIRPVPGIAWIPLMIILFGIGVLSKAMIVFLSSFTACVINSYSGVRQTKTVHLWVGKTFGYSNRRMLFKIGIPTALPMILTGMKAALGTSWGALIAAELLASTAGLGFMIQQARGVLRPDIIIAGMLVIGGVGAFLSYLITLLERAVLKGGRW